MMTDPINELVVALVKAQAELKNAPMNRINPHFKSKYADLASVRDTTSPVLSKHGLVVFQRLEARDTALILHTTLAHTSGQSVSSTYPLPLSLDKPQQMGSALTYARRYCLAAIVGIASEEDDDANAAQGGNGKKAKELPLTTGPHNITKLKALAIEMYNDLQACEDEDQLIAFLNSKPFIEWAEQVQRDQPSWWFGKDDQVGFSDRIEQRRQKIKNMPPSQTAEEAEY